MKKIYIDVDGVLLTSKHTQAAPYGEVFINIIISKYDCFWLTTHCKDGDNRMVLDRLAKYYSADTIKKLQVVKPTKWNTLKTEAIDFESDFYWLDDYVFEAEKKVLKQRNCINKLLLVNLNNERELLDIKLRLEKM